MKKAITPFQFHTKLSLTELIGLKARNIKEMLKYIKTLPDSSIYHHTHKFLQEHLFLSPEPPNDFAYWAKEVFGVPELEEQLASLDITNFENIQNLKEAIAKTIQNYIDLNPDYCSKNVSKDKEFHFIKSINFIFPTGHIANNVIEFIKILTKISIDSIYFHIFDARLRIRHNTNDFAYWFETSLGDKRTADALIKIDPYTHTLEELRETIIHTIKENHYAKT